MVTFDALDPEWTTKHALDFDYDEEIGKLQDELKQEAVLNFNMKDNDFETFNPILNMGGNFNMFICEIICFIFLGILIVVKTKFGDKCKKPKK